MYSISAYTEDSFFAVAASISLLKIVRWKELYTVVGKEQELTAGVVRWWEITSFSVANHPPLPENQQVTQHYTHLFPWHW